MRVFLGGSAGYANSINLTGAESLYQLQKGELSILDWLHRRFAQKT